MAKFKAESFRIALYIRVSTEEQAENPEGSIKNQEQRLRDYIRIRNADGQHFGDVVEVFSDPGISAKDMRRPSLQRLLGKIQTREINLVMVTDLSRLTRSTKDFGVLWDYLAENECKFQSLRENFDSTTAAGEMIMFTLANFAQFERKQTAERISHSFLARAKRGLYNGGAVPLGYEIDDARPGHLLIVKAEAEIVRKIFSTFLKEQTLAQTAKALNSAGVKLPRSPRSSGGARLGHLTIDTVHAILKQKSYIAIRKFKGRDQVEETKAAWNPIIDVSSFERVQKILAKNKSRKKPHSINRYPYVLSGFLFCKTCGDRMGGKSAHGKNEKIAYYEHSWATKSQAALSKKVFTCEPHRILAKRIEPVVWDQVKTFLLNPKIAKTLFSDAAERIRAQDGVNESEKLKRKIAGIQSQLEAMAERISELPKGIDPGVLFAQLGRLQTIKSDLESEMAKASNEISTDVPLRVNDFATFTKGLCSLLAKEGDPVIRGAVIQSVVSKIEVSPSGIEIHFHVGQSHYLREFGDLKRSVSSRTFFDKNLRVELWNGAIQGNIGLRRPVAPVKKGSIRLGKNRKDGCSNSLKIGGRCRT